MTSLTAITGAQGFIGSAVASIATTPLRLLVNDSYHGRDSAVRSVVGRLHQDDALDELLTGVDSVIHCANYIGPDSRAAHETNVLGTANLLEASKRHGVASFVYLSTTGVYGNGPFALADEETPPNPTSVTSRSRHSAERLVLEAGGTVIRPHLVIGRGDTRVGPSIRSALRRLGGQPWPSPAVSVITARSLAMQMLALARLSAPGVFNADHGTPTTIAQLVERLSGETSTASDGIPLGEARRSLAQAGLKAHQVNMLCEESTFTSRLPDVLEEICASVPSEDVAWDAHRGPV